MSKEEDGWYGRTRLIAGAISATALIIPAAFGGVALFVALGHTLAFLNVQLPIVIRIDYAGTILIYAVLAFGMFFRNRYHFAITVVAALVLVISFAASLVYLNHFWTNFV